MLFSQGCNKERGWMGTPAPQFVPKLLLLATTASEKNSVQMAFLTQEMRFQTN